MSGGSGSDTFHFASRVDGEILDFEYGIDRVSFGVAAPFEEFDDVVAQMSETANGVVLSSGSGDQLTLRGRKIDDFLFSGQGASARQIQDDQQSVQSSGAPSTSSASTSGGAAVVGSGLATLTLPELRASDLVEGRAVEATQINGDYIFCKSGRSLAEARGLFAERVTSLPRHSASAKRLCAALRPFHRSASTCAKAPSSSWKYGLVSMDMAKSP